MLAKKLWWALVDSDGSAVDLNVRWLKLWRGAEFKSGWRRVADYATWIKELAAVRARTREAGGKDGVL